MNSPDARPGAADALDSLSDYDVQFGGYDCLMPRRVRQVLLVASPYDAFIIAEDDRLTEIIFSEYLDLNLRFTPQVTRVADAAAALRKLAECPFDLVITMMRLGDMDYLSLAAKAKAIAPHVPVVLLTYSLSDLGRVKESPNIDRTYLWTGDIRILIAIFKQIEDRLNLDEDIRNAGIQVLLLVEDSVRYYSHYLPMIYTELLEQTRRLIAEGVNLSHKMLRIRARPKILLARTYEEAWDIYSRYRSHLLGVVTDIQFPREGKNDPEAGLRLISAIRKEIWDMPALLQSSDASLGARAAGIGACFIQKGSPTLREDVRVFMRDHLGFGDFVFRRPDNSIVGRVPDLPAMVDFLKTVPEESLVYHIKRNHFSRWVMARTEFELSHRIRPRQVSDFEDVEAVRQYLIETFKEFLQNRQAGVVVDFSRHYFRDDCPFVKIGGGSLGGKARGLAFLHSFLSRCKFPEEARGVRIRVPHSIVIGISVFEAFIEENNLRTFLASRPLDDELRGALLRARLPQQVFQDLETIISRVNYPLAVRSSSLLEDSQNQPSAGVYETYMLPNSHPDPAVRLEQLCQAIKMIYASTYLQKARTHLEAVTMTPEDERMGIVIQRLVGARHGSRFYPDISGVAQSYNYYPIAPAKAEEGIATIALGLGRMVVDGGRSMVFVPAHPTRAIQFSTAEDCLANSQREFVALDLKRNEFSPIQGCTGDLQMLDLGAAEADGVLASVGGVYSPDEQRLYEGVSRPGIRLVTFADILHNDGFPLAAILRWVTDFGAKAVGAPVEIEFAVDLAAREFNVLQIRPMASWSVEAEVGLDTVPAERIVCHSPRALGHGIIDSVRDVIYVKPESFDPSGTPVIARQIGELNAALRREGRRFALIGPGRWGSADHSLGIPVRWEEISAACLLVETNLEGFIVDPSFGSHFLHNVISLGIGYFTVRPHAHEGRIDWDWLAAQKPLQETRYVRHLRFDAPLEARIDGRTAEGALLKPAP